MGNVKVLRVFDPEQPDAVFEFTVEGNRLVAMRKIA